MSKSLLQQIIAKETGNGKRLNIYLASSFDESTLLGELLSVIEEYGHFVPDVWWNVNTKLDFITKSDDESFYGSSLVQAIAVRHWQTITECDLVILVSNLEKERSFTGANVEIGYAIGKGIPVLSIGKLKRSAMYAPIIKCKTIDELMKAISCIAQEAR